MASLLPINASSQERAETIARDSFARMAPQGIRLRSLTFVRAEPVRPFARVAASESNVTPTACYVFSVEFGRDAASRA